MATPKQVRKSKAMLLLKKHLRVHWDSNKAFAAALSVNPVQLSTWLNGHLLPSLDVAVRIERLTKSKGEPYILASDWIDKA